MQCTIYYSILIDFISIFVKSNDSKYMKNRLIQILYLILVSLPTISVAQTYSIKRLGVELGLSNNNVVSITQDKLGFLWFATEEGLNKFNGSRFINYYKYSTQSPSISGNELNRVYADESR